MPAAADHDQVHAGDAALDGAGDHVRVHTALGLDVLARLHPRKRAHLVAKPGRFFVAPRFGRDFHLVAQRFNHIVFTAFQEELGALHVFRIALGGNQPGARRSAAPDLMQEARARAVLEHGVLAGTQAKHALQQLDALTHRVCMRKRPEVAVALVARTAVKAEPGELVPGDHQVGIRLVVAKQDVVARREALDEVVLEQQRLALGARRGNLDRSDLREHHANARALVLLLEVRADALLQVAGLADVERLTPFAEHAVHPGQAGQAGDKRLRVEHDKPL